MGKISRGILGGFSGKVANVVGSSWKGIAVMKSLPLSVANPRTSAQQAQRNAFTQCVRFASKILAPVIKPLWDRFAQEESGYNAFISANIERFDSDGLDDPNNLIISRGQMEATEINQIAVIDGNPDVSIQFPTDTPGPLQDSEDEPYAVVWNETKDEVAGAAGGDTVRQDGTITVSMPSDVAGTDTVHAWLAFRRQDGTVVSNTSHDSV